MTDTPTTPDPETADEELVEVTALVRTHGLQRGEVGQLPRSVAEGLAAATPNPLVAINGAADEEAAADDATAPEAKKTTKKATAKTPAGGDDSGV